MYIDPQSMNMLRPIYLNNAFTNRSINSILPLPFEENKFTIYHLSSSWGDLYQLWKHASLFSSYQIAVLLWGRWHQRLQSYFNNKLLDFHSQSNESLIVEN